MTLYLNVAYILNRLTYQEIKVYDYAELNEYCTEKLYIICQLLWRRSACISAWSNQGIYSHSVVNKKAELAESKFSGP